MSIAGVAPTDASASSSMAILNDMRDAKAFSRSKFNTLAVCAMLAASLACAAQTPSASAIKRPATQVSERDVRAEMDFLASDAMQGRGSGTQFELIAGAYIASMLQEFGVEPAGEPGADGKPGYIQTVSLQQSFVAPPVLTAGNAQFTHGKEIAVSAVVRPQWNGPLQKLKTGDAVQAGAVLLVSAGEDISGLRALLGRLAEKQPAAILVADSPQLRTVFTRSASRPARLPQTEKGGAPMTLGPGVTVILLGPEATSQISALNDGAPISFGGQVKDEGFTTWNVVGKLTGTDDKATGQAVLLGAHMDHLGVDPKLQGDQIFNGADDDASGTIAVMELARVLAAGPKPKRTVYFVLFGSEEKGGLGSQYFINHTPVPLEKIVTELEFEMMGRPDAKVPARTLWLTGFDRSDLGTELAAHGANLVADPHPEENFFMRSDNYTLAKRGVVAHTVSSFGLHSDYHHPSDDASKIDFDHLTSSINSMVKPIEWLVDSDFAPKWNAGKKP
jgi:aminopeptidase YwaD